ncbi:hypothetical protein D3C81_1396280 [compost metagenome]
MAHERRLFVEQVFRHIVEQRAAHAGGVAVHLARAIDYTLRHAVTDRAAHYTAQRPRQVFGGVPAQVAGQRGHGVGQFRIAFDPHMAHRGGLPALGHVGHHQRPLLQRHQQCHSRRLGHRGLFDAALFGHLQPQREGGGIETDHAAGKGRQQRAGPRLLFDQVIECGDDRRGQRGRQGVHGERSAEIGQ